MKLTVASEYGCLALLAIAEKHPEWCKRQEISDRYDIPVPFLEQILSKLATAGLIASRRGAEGGFRLAREPRQITIASVVRTMDGPLAPVRSVSENFYQPTPLEASPGFQRLFRKVRDVVAHILETTSLEDIVAQELSIRRRRGKPAARSRYAGRRVRRP